METNIVSSKDSSYDYTDHLLNAKPSKTQFTKKNLLFAALLILGGAGILGGTCKAFISGGGLGGSLALGGLLVFTSSAAFTFIYSGNKKKQEPRKIPVPTDGTPEYNGE